MELSKGLKKSEVGSIPNDWQVASIGEICDIKVGRDLNENFYSQISDHNFKYPVFSNTVSDYGLYGYYNFAEYDGEAVTVVGRGVGLGCAFPRTGGFGAIGRLLVLFPKKTVKNNFLSSYINNRITIFNESGGIPQLTGISFSKYKVPIPPVKEQVAIANALSDADAYIESLEKLIAKKCLIKKGVMQELLTGKRRLAGFNAKWEMKSLGSIVELYQPKTISAKEFTESGYPVYGANGIVGFYNQANHTTWQVTITCRGSTCGTINRTVEKCWITGNAMVVNCDNNNDIDKQFLYHKLYLTDLSGCITGTGQPQIVRGPLARVSLEIPADKKEQMEIGKILTDIDHDISTLEINLAKARLLKQGMMQELLTGRIRLV